MLGGSPPSLAILPHPGAEKTFLLLSFYSNRNPSQFSIIGREFTLYLAIYLHIYDTVPSAIDKIKKELLSLF